MNNKKFQIITLGCKVNQCESEAIAGVLTAQGWQAAPENEPADVCIVNTCTVTHKASMQSRQAVRQLHRTHPDARIIVTGCYAQTEPEALQEIEGIQAIVGHDEKHRVPEIIQSLLDSPGETRRLIREAKVRDKKFREIPLAPSGKRTRPFLKIQDGCNAFCTYCIVPHARGRSRSMEPDAVLKAMQKLKADGFREVVLSGIHIGCYGRDLTPQTDFYALLKRIDREAPIDRVRISSVEPLELTDEIIQLVADSGRFCRHFHIPLQSGDDGILKRMHRPYSSGYFRDLVEKIHARIPDAAIGVDTLIGFPGESDEAFENTFHLIDSLPAAYLHAFPFSPRQGTPAADCPDQVDHAVVKERCRRMRALGAKKRAAFYKKFVGKTVSVLIEGKRDAVTGRLKGVSANYLTVTMDDDRDGLTNTILPVQIVKVTAGPSAEGRIIG